DRRGCGVEQAVRRDRRMVWTGHLRHLARDGPARALVRVHTDDTGDQGRTDDAPLAGAFALVQRGDDPVRAVHAGEQVGDGDADLRRLLRVGSGDAHQPGLALGDLVVAGARCLRAVVTEAGD